MAVADVLRPGTGMAGDVNSPAGGAASGLVDAVFGALAHERRRRALYYLRDRPDEAVPVEDLAGTLAAREGDGAGDPPVERVAASLVHHHLPKLADADLVEHDRDAGTVAYAGGPVADACLDVGSSVETR